MNCLAYTIDKHNGTITAIATILLVFVTAGLIWGGFHQEATTQQQLRAYCMVARAEILDVEVGKRPKARITIKNFGQTPAREFRQIATMAYDTYPITRLGNPNFRDAKKVEQPLPPGGYFDIYPELSMSISEKKHIDDLRNGAAAIYVVGEISYRDAFGKERFTKYKVFAGGAIGFTSSGMTAYEDGNDYT